MMMMKRTRTTSRTTTTRSTNKKTTKKTTQLTIKTMFSFIIGAINKTVLIYWLVSCMHDFVLVHTIFLFYQENIWKFTESSMGSIWECMNPLGLGSNSYSTPVWGSTSIIPKVLYEVIKHNIITIFLSWLMLGVIFATFNFTKWPNKNLW